MIRGTAAAASDPVAAEAARAALDAAGSAVDAVVSGFLAAAGAHPDVLFAPAVALAAGAGVGARAFDGRAAQPGRGAPRPRGFVDAGAVPPGAYVAAPRALAMLILLHGYLGRGKLRDLARPGVAAAERAGAAQRAALLRQIGSSGVVALHGRDVERALLAAGGPVAGGALSAEDLAEILPAEAEARITDLGDGAALLRPPWPAGVAGGAAAGAALRAAEAIVACDGRGTLAALAYVRAGDGGVPVAELDVVLGRDAVPVRRKVPRVAPGTPLPAPAPIAILRRGGLSVAMALPGEAGFGAEALTALPAVLAMESVLEALRAQAGAATAIAVVQDGRDARVVSAGAGGAAGRPPAG